nr:MAG TPA: hypothetical protein [Siphoviridae sp. ctmtD6]
MCKIKGLGSGCYRHLAFYSLVSPTAYQQQEQKEQNLNRSSIHFLTLYVLAPASVGAFPLSPYYDKMNYNVSYKIKQVLF